MNWEKLRLSKRIYSIVKKELIKWQFTVSGGQVGRANRESLNYFKMSGSQGPLYLDERQSLVCVYVCVGGGEWGGSPGSLSSPGSA